MERGTLLFSNRSFIEVLKEKAFKTVFDALGWAPIKKRGVKKRVGVK